MSELANILLCYPPWRMTEIIYAFTLLTMFGLSLAILVLKECYADEEESKKITTSTYNGAVVGLIGSIVMTVIFYFLMDPSLMTQPLQAIILINIFWMIFTTTMIFYDLDGMEESTLRDVATGLSVISVLLIPIVFIIMSKTEEHFSEEINE